MPTLTLSGVTSDSSQWIFTWSTVSQPAGVPAPTFSPNGTNAAQSTTVTTFGAGNYQFSCAVSGIAATVAGTTPPPTTSPPTTTHAPTTTASPTTSTTAAGGNPVLTSLTLFPGTVSVGTAWKQLFAPLALDQFGNQMSPAPAYTWSVTGSGSIDGNGVYTAPGSPGSATINVSAGGLTAHATITIITPPAPGHYLDTNTGILSIYPDRPDVHSNYFKSQCKSQVLNSGGVDYLYSVIQSYDVNNGTILFITPRTPVAGVTKIIYYGQASLGSYYTNTTGLAVVAFGGAGTNQLVGSTVNDELYGGVAPSYNQLQGGDGNDTLVGGQGTNYLWGNAGIDVIIPGQGTNYVYPD